MEESPQHGVQQPVKKEPPDQNLLVDWLQEMPEELDVFIAQRYFEQAVDLILRSEQSTVLLIRKVKPLTQFGVERQLLGSHLMYLLCW